jgi:hypothetical protein
VERLSARLSHPLINMLEPEFQVVSDRMASRADELIDALSCWTLIYMNQPLPDKEILGIGRSFRWCGAKMKNAALPL